MPVKLLYLGLLLVLVCCCWAKKQQCLNSIYTCDECIQSGPECAWCTAPDSKIRCQTLSGLERVGCLPEHVYNPQGGVQIARNDSSSESVNSKSLFLQPQELAVQLRPGVRQSFPLTITMATDQPIRELIMDTSHVPVGVNITFSYILQRKPMVVEVHVEASRCLSEKDDSNQMHNRTGPWSVFITPRGFSQSVKLEMTVECQCACTGNRQENSHACSGQGALVCGKCRCYEPYIGQRCEWNLESTDIENEDGCRSGPNAPVCSARGACIFGLCECNIRENPEEKYSGRYCECSNFNCPFGNNRICGGHGKCECGRCICDDGWTDEDCSCSMETASCMARNHMVCNGKGICQCGRCKCEKPYGGLTCEVCPTCPGTCQEYSKCVECRAFGTGAKGEWCDRQCSHLTVEMVETQQDLTGDLCKMRSHDNFCFFYFSYSRTPFGPQFTVLRFQQCYGK